jgi:hypothetical protein
MDWTGITASIIGAHGEACTYTPLGGAALALTAVISHGVELADPSGQLVERVRTATIDKADLAGAPVVGDQITAGGEDYYVQRVLADDDAAVRLVIA